MKLTLHDLKNQSAWERAGIALPSYDPAALAERTKAAPAWKYFPYIYGIHCRPAGIRGMDGSGNYLCGAL